MTGHPGNTPPVGDNRTVLNLTVNGQACQSDAVTLQDWVNAQGLVPQAIATALNGRFVRRDARAALRLNEGDVILTFQPIEGG